MKSALILSDICVEVYFCKSDIIFMLSESNKLQTIAISLIKFKFSTSSSILGGHPSRIIAAPASLILLSTKESLFRSGGSFKFFRDSSEMPQLTTL